MKVIIYEMCHLQREVIEIQNNLQNVKAKGAVTKWKFSKKSHKFVTYKVFTIIFGFR